MAVIVLVMGAVLIFLLQMYERSNSSRDSWKKMLRAFRTVFSNPQSILCGLIAGLLFVPTTIFDMIWGVRYLRKHTAWSMRRR